MSYPRPISYVDDPQELTPNATFPGERPEFGLVELASGHDSIVDIIAIHGLDGHCEKSWTAENGVLWLRDLLPVDIPRARIFTYGYDAYTRGREQVTDHSLYDHAQNLISHLANKRRSTGTEDRPIIFVAHSFGGNVLKYALIHAHSASKHHNLHHKAVELSTFGILFLGTPHQGSDNVDLAMIILGIQSVYSETSVALLSDLRSHSKGLQQQLAQYTSIAGNYETRFFYEAYPTRLFHGISQLLVPKSSAIVPGMVNAEANILYKDHVGMTKFKHAGDGDLQTLSLHLSWMVQAAPQKVEERWERYKRHEELNLATSPRKNICALPVFPYHSGQSAFVGRIELMDQIHTQFSQHHRVILNGTGGIGTSRIAAEYIYAHRRDYEIVFWVNAETLESIRSGYVDIAQQLVDCIFKTSGRSDPNSGATYKSVAHDLGLDGLVDSNGIVSSWVGDMERIVITVRGLLSHDSSGKWLMVLDNADNLNSVPFDNLIPMGSSGNVLLTSQSMESHRLGTVIEIPPMNDIDGLRLLLQEAHVADDYDQVAASEVVRKLGGLPLAITQAGAYISALRVPFREYIEQYDSQWNQLVSEKPSLAQWEGNKSIITTWEMSFRLIESRHPYAANLALLCAFLGNEDIPSYFFRRSLEPRYDIAWEIARSQRGFVEPPPYFPPREPDSFDKALRHLVSFSLAQPIFDHDRFRFHPLIHVWTRERMTQRQRCWMVLNSARLVVDVLGNVNGQRMTHMSKQQATPHIRAVARNVMKDGLPGYHHKADRSIFYTVDDLGALCHDVTLYDDARKLRFASLQWRETFWGARDPMFRGMDDLEAEETFFPCRFQYDQGEELFKSAVEDCKNNPWGFGRGILEARAIDSMSYVHDGELEYLLQRLAEVFYVDAWREHHLTGLAMVATLGALSMYEHRFEESEILLRCVTTHLSEDTRDHFHFLVAVANLGRLWTQPCRPEDPQMSICPNDMINPGSIEHSGAEFVARAKVEDAAKLLRKVPECSYPFSGSTSEILEALPNILMILGSFEEPEKYLQISAEQLKLSLGPHHWKTTLCFSVLGKTMVNRGAYKEAEYALKHAIKGYERSFGPNSLWTLQSVSDLGKVLMELGRIDEAVPLLRRVMEGWEQIRGFEHSLTIASVKDLGIALAKLGKYEEGEELLRRAVESYSLKDDKKGVLACIRILGRILEDHSNVR
ncbi:hypothetical protein PILCRDRAFT_670138 [Piloderma croceum F 1598]|uniref:Uncharacterized protein n=1 Tax=Piloderma croceum (strain F 1598) TaxID=765440 RepID=A0A0C3F6D3_PILCF|nr:hypothetical protein PILCRDRAFT_670138 [Piloderma croceum F 1598]